jgi:SSS family solute:Na+ symporter
MTALIVIGIYLALLLGLGLFSSRLFRGTSEDYLLASHSIGPFVLLMSLFGTTMTAFALVGSTGEAYKEGIGVYGMLASSSGIIHSLCFLLIGVKIWQFGRKYGYSTQIEFFRDRLGNNSIGLLLFPVLVGLIIPYLLIGVIASGLTINGLTRGEFPELFALTHGGVPPWLGSGVICGVVLIYVFFGGMRGTAWANTFQTAVFMVLGVVTFFVIAYKLGGQDSLLANLQVASQAVSAEKLSLAHTPKLVFFTFMLIPLSVGMFPHIFQHWLTAKSAESFKLPIIVHPIFILIVWAPCVLVGVWATTELANVPEGLPANAILVFLVKSLSDKFLGALLTAGILAAIMSSLDSQFLCLGTMFTNDIVVHYAGKDRYSDTQKIWLARGFIVAVVAVTYTLGLFEPRRVFLLGIWCFSGFSGLFPLIFAALYWRRLTVAGAYASILATMGTWLYLFAQSDWAANAHYKISLSIGGNEYQAMPVAAIFLASVVALVIVSLVTAPPEEERLARFFDKPRG